MANSSKSITVRKVKVIRPASGAVYSVAQIVETTGVSRKFVLDLCKWRVIEPAKGKTPDNYRFHEETIYRIRRAHQLIRMHELRSSAARVFLHLLEENERLRRELRFWRG